MNRKKSEKTRKNKAMAEHNNLQNFTKSRNDPETTQKREKKKKTYENLKIKKKS